MRILILLVVVVSIRAQLFEKCNDLFAKFVSDHKLKYSPSTFEVWWILCLCDCAVLQSPTGPHLLWDLEISILEFLYIAFSTC